MLLIRLKRLVRNNCGISIIKILELTKRFEIKIGINVKSKNLILVSISLGCKKISIKTLLYKI